MADEHKESPATGDAKPDTGRALLCEVSWEVCNQLGGIYTVVRSKVPRMVKDWDDRYCLVGPYNPASANVEFEASPMTGPFGHAAAAMKEAGFDVRFGRWLVTGHPRVILLNHRSVLDRLNSLKGRIWETDKINMLASDNWSDDAVAFGALVEELFKTLAAREAPHRPVIGHFHEWMAATAISPIRHAGLPVATVFTTHATQLGRFLAMDDSAYHKHLPQVDWLAAAKRYNLEVKASLERVAARKCHVLSTVSQITGNECKHLLGRAPDVLLPNGLNIERFTALHEFQNLHRKYKDQIHQFVMGHFFPYYTFDLDKTLYFLTSGRYEYTNKGFDLTIEAMGRLNSRLKKEPLGCTIVFFIITKAAVKSINPNVLRGRAVMEEIHRDCEAIQKQVGERLFMSVSGGQWPKLDDLVDEYWKLRLRRNLQAWKHHGGTPALATYDLAYERDDAVMRHIKAAGLFNRPEDPVKIVFQPDFITASDPLFGMDYDQFVRGCHLGIFPSLYEPWGYAPLECMVLGIPAVMSDMAGFGSYVSTHIRESEKHGIWVLERQGVDFPAAADKLAAICWDFAKLNRRERIALRNKTESFSEMFDWNRLGDFYRQAHELALQRMK